MPSLEEKRAKRVAIVITLIYFTMIVLTGLDSKHGYLGGISRHGLSTAVLVLTAWAWFGSWVFYHHLKSKREKEDRS
jgi:hypothetical protein